MTIEQKSERTYYGMPAAYRVVHGIRTHLSTDPASQTSRSVVLSQWSSFVLLLAFY